MRSRRIIKRAPFLLLGGACIGWAITLPYYKTDEQAYLAVGWTVVFCSFVAPFLMLGRAATLIGSSWLVFGVAPMLLVPIVPMISWLMLFDRQKKLLESSLEVNGADPSSNDA